MDCQEAQDLLYASDAIESPAEALRSHMGTCDACRQLQLKLSRLEQAVRQLPVPHGADAAREAFENRLADRAQQTSPRRLPWPLRIGYGRLAAAAVLLIGTSLALWLYYRGGTSPAESDSLSELMALNMDVARQATPEDRAREYSSIAAKYQHYTQQAPQDQRELAQAIASEGQWLTMNDDPLAEADHFTSLANDLLDRMDRAAEGNRAQLLGGLSRSYCKLVERGIGPRVKRLMADQKLDAQRLKRLNRIMDDNGKHQPRLERILKKAPRQLRVEIRRALEVHKKQIQHAAARKGK
jgi:hypothetical protein